jgi:ubiquitin-small subunit ribosomal protein S27Ae
MAKTQRKKKRTSKVNKNYSVSGGKLERKNKTCPKCGSGVFLAKHKGRLTCGKCQYMEKV